MTHDVYTIKELQNILKLSRSTIYSFMKDPPFPVMKFGATYRISKEAFDAWYKEVNKSK